MWERRRGSRRGIGLDTEYISYDLHELSVGFIVNNWFLVLIFCCRTLLILAGIFLFLVITCLDTSSFSLECERERALGVLLCYSLGH